MASLWVKILANKSEEIKRFSELLTFA